MAISGNNQALIAAFAFGIVVNAASAALFLYTKGHGTKLFRDGLRLVLITFLATSALWAQISFISTVIDPSSTSGCQISVIFSAGFDQVARVALEQYLLWALSSGIKVSTGSFVPQAFLFLRFILGAFFVGFQRPQFGPVCVTRTEVLPVGIALIATDAVMVLVLIVRAFSVGLVKDIRENRAGGHRSKGILLTIVGLAAWTGASVPMFLGIDTIDMVWRTAIPAAALSVLVGIVTAFMGSLLLSRDRASMLPSGPQSPGGFNPNRDLQSRDISTSDSDYPPSRYEDLKVGVTTTAYAMPREAPRPDTSGGNGAPLPSITRPAPGQAAAGVGGIPVQGQLFPPMRAQTAPARDVQRSDSKAQPKQKKSFFDMSKGGPAANIPVGKLTISNPIIQDASEANPLNKIATIDLATAARNERERRDMALLQRSSSLVAQRPAPQPPGLTPEEAMRRTQSVRRKEIASTAASFVAPKSQLIEPAMDLMPQANATTTSAQLSPGVEEIRRRSPRQLPEAFQKETMARPISPPRPEPRIAVSPPRPAGPQRPERPADPELPPIPQQAPEQSPNRRSMRPQQPGPASLPQPEVKMEVAPQPGLPSTWPIQASVKATIRPSRQRPATPPLVEEEPVASKTLLQRRPTTGLPSNPRAQGLKALAKEASIAKEQTVMFINNIQYNDPTAVQSIIQGATDRASKSRSTMKPAGDELKSGKSVVNRPRPIPRNPDKDRQLFPSEASPNQHRRTRSGGSITSRKSILRSNPGSPTQLPPLPPHPLSAGNPLRPLPNDTKSMTFDEKMNLFFPAPPSAGSNSKRRSSVPEMPALPAAFFDSSISVPDEWDAEIARSRSNKTSDRSTKTSVTTQEILQVNELPRRPYVARNTSKFSVDTHIAPSTRNVADELDDSWIPGISHENHSRPDRSYEGGNRRSSPVIPIRPISVSEFSEARTRDEEATTNWGSVHSPVAAVHIQQARYIPKSTYIPKRESDRDPRNMSFINNDGNGEVMTFMLDASVEYAKDSWLDEKTPQLRVGNNGIDWHHRVGDECESFSDRREKVRSRRMPPPTPLLLNSTSNKNAIVLQAAEPSPLESPQQAYEMIQAQLKKFEQPNRASVESQGKRLALLEDLEREMGQQENQWHEMQHDLTRDSVSTVKTSPNPDSRHQSTSMGAAVSRELSQRSIAADRRASRRARMRSGSIAKSSMEDLSVSATMSSDNTRASTWQERLAEAQTEYIGNAPDLLARRNLNFLALSNSKVQLGSPTPPDTDESDSDGEFDERIMSQSAWPSRQNVVAQLWKPAAPKETRSRALLWAPVIKTGTSQNPRIVNPSLFVRSASRKSSGSLAIHSSQLWQKSTQGSKVSRSTGGLWGSTAYQPPKIQARPLTMRPPRRNKRVTLLPDILESPQPLPDKRGTLGIFQFPWGEKSDTATVQTRPSHMFMAMPGTMSSGGPAIRAALEERAKQLEAQEYSSSFFDDYDEEEEEDVVSDMEEMDEDGSDDGFDENTLWEIASLLKSDQVPSKNSLLPQARYRGESSIVEEYIAEVPSDDEEGDNRHDSIVLGIDADSFPAPPGQSTLWAGNSSPEPASQNNGLPQPDEHVWRGLKSTADEAPRAQTRQAEPATIQSYSMWNSSIKPSKMRPADRLWNVSTQQGPASLWTAPAAINASEPKGLFNPSHKRAAYRTTSAEPAALKMTRKPRVVNEALPRLTSTSLWTVGVNSRFAPDWTSVSLVSHKSSKAAPSSRDEVILSSNADIKKPTWWESMQSKIPGRSEPKHASAKKSTPRESSAMHRGDWEAALDEAIAASYPKRTIRRNATEADWDLALNQALTANRPLRKAATAADWSAALDDAMVKSTNSDIPRRQGSKNVARDRRLSRSESRRKREEILAQTKVVESSDGPFLTASKFSPPTRQTTQMWSKPAADRPASPSMLWSAPKQKKTSSLEFALRPIEDWGSDGLRRKHSKVPTDRKAEIRAQIAAIEAGADPALLGLVSFHGQGMWNRFEGEERKKGVPRGGGKNWLDNGVHHQVSRVQFRY